MVINGDFFSSLINPYSSDWSTDWENNQELATLWVFWIIKELNVLIGTCTCSFHPYWNLYLVYFIFNKIQTRYHVFNTPFVHAVPLILAAIILLLNDITILILHPSLLLISCRMMSYVECSRWILIVSQDTTKTSVS